MSDFRKQWDKAIRMTNQYRDLCLTVDYMTTDSISNLRSSLSADENELLNEIIGRFDKVDEVSRKEPTTEKEKVIQRIINLIKKTDGQ